MQTRTSIQLSSTDEIEEFVYAASHDLKAPLRAVDAVSHWIEDDLKTARGDELESHLKLLRMRLARMNRLIDDLLAYSRADRHPEAPTRVELQALAESLVAGIAPRRGIRIEIKPGLPLFEASATPLAQALGHLISNAVRHHDKMAGTVTVSAIATDKDVEICVSDDGPGIDPSLHQRIFQVCQTLKPKDGVEGSGIGLALVKKVAQRHGASLSLDSAPGKGSAFYLKWPKGA